MERYKLSMVGRERIGMIVVILAFLLLATGLVRLQVVEHAQLAAQSENNRIRVVPIVPRRGRVYDREARIIIDNRPSYTVSVVPAEIIPGQTLPNLARQIGLDTLEIRARIGKNMVSRFQPAPVKSDIPFEVRAVLEEQYEKFPGVSYQMEQVRRYSDSLRAEVVTGYVGEASRTELDQAARTDLRLGSMIGKKGLEKQYDHLLRGTEGTEYVEVSASGQIRGSYRGKPRIEAVPGVDLFLTIDNDLQMACQQVPDSFCCWAVVAMDPRSGELLAMTSNPGYDANIFSSVIPESLWQAISTDSTHPLLNRPLSGLYPPGSIVKPVTLGAGLEVGIVTPHSTFNPCYGGFLFGNRVFHCWDRGGHGLLSAAAAIEQSCDIFMYQLGLKLGIDPLSDYYARCGFARPTGVDIPGEAAGLNPSRSYYDQRYGKNKWTRGLLLNTSIGQGEVLATPLQLARFYCGLANYGVVYKPHCVKSMILPNGETVTPFPERSFRLPFSRATLEVLKDGLRRVVEGEKGTARGLYTDRYAIGGKTGTSQNPHGEDHSLFVGIAPLEAPEIVVCALVENAGHGSEVAAPVVGRVIDAYMSKRLAREQIAEMESREQR
jgi:penicillin-binding protein 2